MALGSTAAFRQFAIVTLTASTTSTGTALPPGGDTLVVTNPNTALAWIAVGPGNTPPTAVVGSGVPVLPGQRRIFAATGVTQVSAVMSTGAGSIYVETGTGNEA
jgi:hypothetical protein